MYEFPVLDKYSKFKWTTNKIVYSVMLAGFIVMYLIDHIINKAQNNILRKIMVLSFAGGWFFAIIIKFINIGKAEPFHGKLNGYLHFEMDQISIQNQVFTLEQIKDIQMSNDDYYGKSTGSSRGNFGPTLFNGSDNKITLSFISGESKTWNFVQNDGNDIQKVKRELMNYHLNGKLQFSVLAYLLGDNSQKEKNILKEEIEKLAK